jgi:hypothetical protein
VAYRPAYFHTAWPTRDLGRFADPTRQGRFEAMLRDFAAADVGFVAASRAVAEGRVRENELPYAWEPEVMVRWLEGAEVADDAKLVAAARERTRFTIAARA